MVEQGKKTGSYNLRNDDWINKHHANLRIGSCWEISKKYLPSTRYIHPFTDCKGFFFEPFLKNSFFFFFYLQFVSTSRFQPEGEMKIGKKKL